MYCGSIIPETAIPSSEARRRSAAPAGLASRFPDHRIAMTLIAVVVVVAAMIAFALAWQTTAARGAMRRGPLEAISHALSATRTVRSVRYDDCAARRRCTGSR